MFYSPGECLMRNYSLSKQISTVGFFLSFFFLSGALMRLTGCLSVWLAECSVLSLCNMLWCSLDAGLAQWAANGLSSMARDAGHYSKGPRCFVFSLCCYCLPCRSICDIESSPGFYLQSFRIDRFILMIEMFPHRQSVLCCYFDYDPK